MYSVPWIVVELIAGWFAGKFLKGNTYGPVMGVGMGICGAVAGGLLMQSAGFDGYAGTIFTTFVAMITAVFLTLFGGSGWPKDVRLATVSVTQAWRV